MKRPCPLAWKVLLIWLPAAAAKTYVAVHTSLTGLRPPFGPEDIAGGVVFAPEGGALVYFGVVSPEGKICHATTVPVQLHQRILVEILKHES